jgi:hypothetical protein
MQNVSSFIGNILPGDSRGDMRNGSLIFHRSNPTRMAMTEEVFTPIKVTIGSPRAVGAHF